MAAVLDESMGFAAWHQGHPVVAATLTVHFRRKLPLGEVFVVRARVCGSTGRKVDTTGCIESRDGTICYAEAEGTFIERSGEEFRTLRDTIPRN